MIEMTRERYQQGGTADGSGPGNKRKKRWKRQTNLLTQTCPCFSTKIKITKQPHAVCVHLEKGERCRKGGRYRQGALHAYSLAECQV